MLSNFSNSCSSESRFYHNLFPHLFCLSLYIILFSILQKYVTQLYFFLIGFLLILGGSKFFFFFVNLRFIKGTKSKRGRSPIQESKNIKPKQGADTHKNFWTVNLKEKPLGKKPSNFYHVVDYPAINGHTSRRETDLFLRCQRDGTTELRVGET